MSSDNQIRPVMRSDVAYTWAMAIKAAIENAPGDVLKTCLTCCVFDEAREACKKFNGMRPPARVIAYGCKDYFSNDELPF